MSRLMYPSFVRFVVILLIGAQVSYGVPLLAQSRQAPPVEPAPRDTPVRVNRTVPRVTRPSATLRFSAAPTREEIFRARVFPEPLVPVGGAPTPDENQALARALEEFQRRGDRNSLEPLTEFLAKHPQSVWRPSLLAGIGAVQRDNGAYSRAMATWDEVWNLAGGSTEPFARAVADYAIGEWLTTVASFGQTGLVLNRIEALGRRSVRGPAGVKVEQARETVSLMTKYPERLIASGPEAIRVLLASRDGEAPLPAPLAEYRPGLAGTTLSEVSRLANAVGLKMRPARRLGGDAIPVPAIMHWKIGHFSPIVERSGDRYLVVDVALGRSVWISRTTLLSEASESFLVPESAPEDEWAPMSRVDASAIVGRSCPPGGAATPPPEPCENKGMCGYMFQPETANLILSDTPVGYVPARGPAVNFHLTYQQREMLQPQIFSYGNVGALWTFSWLRFVQEEPAQQICIIPPCSPAHVWVQMPSSGREVHVDTNSDGVYDANWRSLATLVRVSNSPVRYERRLTDGTVEVYTVSDSAAAGQRRIFISELIDPQGNTLQFTWDAQFRLQAVTDDLGQVTTLAYTHPTDPLKVTTVTDPFGRAATLDYDVEGRLISTTDVIEITSRFSYGTGDYGTGDFISALTTPYGTSTFRHAIADTVWDRMIEATDPLGQTERLEYHVQTAGMVATAPSAEVPAGFESFNAGLDMFNTFYWNKQAYAQGRGDRSKATIIRWAQRSEFAQYPVRTAVAHSVKRPLEGRVWYAYPGQTGDYIGWFKQPIKVARKLDDGTSQVSEQTFDLLGNVLTSTDPKGRRTSYTYASNGIDLLQVRQTTGSMNDLLATFSNYTAQHRPQTITDAAAQTSTITYNAEGRPLTVTNPKNETTTFVYNTDGQLTSVTGPVSGSTVTLTYDGYGRVRTSTTPDGVTLTMDYDAFDRPTRVTYPDGTYEAYTYERMDLATHRDRQGRITRMYYDALGRVTGTRDPLGRTVQQIWGDSGAVEKLIDAKGQATSWVYDLHGRVTSEVRANGTTTYTYESIAGRLKTVTDPKGQVTTFTYGQDDSLTSRAYTNAVVATPTVSYTYDLNYPRVATMIDGQGTTTYSYKPVGQLGAGAVASIDGPLANDTLAYSYDQLGRAVSRTLNGTGVTWTFDALGRTTSAVNPLGTFTYTYDGVTSRLATATYPNGQTSTYSYFGGTDDRRLQTIHHKTPGAATLSKFDYSYDTVGNIKTWTQQADVTAPVQWAYGYDAANQLISAVKATTGAPPAMLARFAYRYDTAGNRSEEQIDDALMGATHNASNQLTSQHPAGVLKVAGQLSEAATVTIDGKPATVDATNRFTGTKTIAPGANVFAVVARDGAGNTTSQTYDLASSGTAKAFTYDPNGNLLSDGTRTFEWDAVDQLLAVNNGTKRSEFTYDGESRRVRIVEKESGATVRDARFFWAGTSIVEERLSTGQVNRFFGDSEQHNGAARYVTRDHLGSVREVTDSSGGIVTRNDYDPYGRLTRVSGSEDSRFGFTGHYTHTPTALALTLYRAYDSNAGRWLSLDPLREFGGRNLYAYVDGAPTTERDELGLEGGPVNLSAGYTGRVDKFNTRGAASYEIHVYSPSGKEVGILGPQGFINKHGLTEPPTLPESVRIRLNGVNVQQLRALEPSPIGARGTQNIRRGNYPGGRQLFPRMSGVLTFMAIFHELVPFLDVWLRARDCGRSFDEQLRLDLKDAGPWLRDDYGRPVRNPFYDPST